MEPEMASIEDQPVFPGNRDALHSTKKTNRADHGPSREEPPKPNARQ